MGDKDLAIIASEAHKMAIPEVHVPENAPTWVHEMFPLLIRSIYVSCNNNIEGVIVDFNKSIEHLQSQINQLQETIGQLTCTHTTEPYNRNEEAERHSAYQAIPGRK